MIEIIVLEYLKKNMSSPVFMEEPKEPPAKFILIERVGGGESNKIHRASFAIKSYGQSMYEACKLNEELKKYMLDMPYFEDVSSVKLDSDYNFTDTSTKRYRYQAVFDMSY